MQDGLVSSRGRTATWCKALASILPETTPPPSARAVCFSSLLGVSFPSLVTTRMQITIYERLSRQAPRFSSSFHIHEEHRRSLHRELRQREAPRIGNISPKTRLCSASPLTAGGSLSRGRGEPTSTVPPPTFSGASTSRAIGPRTSSGRRPGLSSRLLRHSTGPNAATQYSVEE